MRTVLRWRFPPPGRLAVASCRAMAFRAGSGSSTTSLSSPDHGPDGQGAPRTPYDDAQPNDLDRSFLQLAEHGASHLPRLFRDLMSSKVCYLTQSAQATTVGDALTLPSSSSKDGSHSDATAALHPAMFSSPWAARRYLLKHNLLLTQELAQATIQQIDAREFLQRTRPATVLLNPPVFVLTPEMIASLLNLDDNEDDNDPDKNNDDDDNIHNRHNASYDLVARLEPHFASMKYSAPSEHNSPPSDIVQAIHGVLKDQNVVTAAYLLDYQFPDAPAEVPPQRVLACLCSLTQTEQFATVEADLVPILRRHKIATLCLNLVPDTNVLEHVVDRLVPTFLHTGHMSELEFALFLDKISVGPAPPLAPSQRQALQADMTRHKARAAYRLVYQVAGYTPQIGTFYEVNDDNDDDKDDAHRSDHRPATFPECLHRGWGYLPDLPPEIVLYIRQNVPRIEP